MQQITDALTNLQCSTGHGEVSRNYGSKEVSAAELTAFTSSLFGTLAQTREVILGSRRIGKVASRPYFGFVGSG